MNTGDWIAAYWTAIGTTVALLDTTKWGLLKDELNKEFKNPKAKVAMAVVFFTANVILMWPDTLCRMLNKQKRSN